MNRRDLLLFRTNSGKKVFELACERLYMRYLDTRRPSAPAGGLDDHWLGEPEPQYASTSTRDLFDGLQRDLAGADVLRVIDRHWLADAELRREVDALVARFRAAGGRVEFVTAAPGSTAPAQPG